ncbi:amidohydrolase family protein [Maribacter halichondriae]|uniref:amidohydrolase family protein n=1 Tax=Maribacter halichondriae TaxID=2980554 RepID=UPI00235A39DF|nr:amidohydrolase family protein [Maribacter sp. Hal144]
MKKIVFVPLLLLYLSCGLIQKNNVGTATLISNVNVVDVANGKILESQNVVIDSGQIKSISTDIMERDTFAQVIEGKEKYLMPGLAEMHAHIPPASTDPERIEDVLFLYLSNGITTIRGMLGDPIHLGLREKVTNGEILGPRIFTSSPSLNGNSVKTKDEAIEKVTAYQKLGYDFLKIHPGIQREVFDQVVETANEVGIPFAGHVPVDVGIRHALESKYASIDHVDGFLEGLVPESANVKPEENGFFGYNFTPLADVSKIDELVALAKQNEVWIVPTQSLFERWFAPVPASVLLRQPEMKYMPTETLENWKQRKEESMAPESGFNEAQWKRFNTIRKQLIKKLQENGHGMLLGSDAPQLFNVPGFSIHHEIDGMQAAGLSNLEIIQSGTLNPAIYFDMEDVFGQVKEGLEADLILLNTNPLEDLDALQNLSGVIRQGKWLPKVSINKRLKQISNKNTIRSSKTAVNPTLASQLQGTWKYYSEKGKKPAPSSTFERIKVLSDGHWNLNETNTLTDKLAHKHGGIYEIKGNIYYETVTFANQSSAYLLNETLEFDLEVKGDTLTQTGLNNEYDEIWVRIE